MMYMMMDVFINVSVVWIGFQSIVIWSSTGEPVKVLPECHKDWISACALADNDSYLVSCLSNVGGEREKGGVFAMLF